MPNIIEAIKNTFNSIADDEPTPPINIIEASYTWLYYGIVMEAIAFEEAGLNTTSDDELKGILKDAIKLCQEQAKETERLMRKEGLTLPPVSEPKPFTSNHDIPPGVKLTDDEISNGLAMKILAMTTKASLAATEGVRTDIGAMYVRFFNEAAIFGATLKTKMRKRGWAKLPPAYTPPGV
ncbi:hypothetical protein JCM9140_4022 [Halalkalibacter wakoensis JCM 9140]|uniref:DUF3231 family protein n=1 Tax=Halalkalibacter wakoensis JCM 9140 TaxID=1236970 RepID=W4Q7B7_9BACI|nr:DUF3231 family protein [Halalkalibacter wakoensis]GAE27860.1 hypothetical protein JCM9140_4022 [Halalkalibacter wakoensis JCM 9140]